MDPQKVQGGCKTFYHRGSLNEAGIQRHTYLCVDLRKFERTVVTNDNELEEPKKRRNLISATRESQTLRDFRNFGRLPCAGRFGLGETTLAVRNLEIIDKYVVDLLVNPYLSALCSIESPSCFSMSSSVTVLHSSSSRRASIASASNGFSYVVGISFTTFNFIYVLICNFRCSMFIIGPAE
ncbi:hypothetical protein J2S04_002570 [Alicyclobacillus tengchongensis]|uniref:Uncharacterized protein n=1 Tax=Alicyclobacillus tolerans TaxID=90970 RepID=A0ABT9LZ96_9BACL|nr:hypothetical protein [Alicyclobacillus tengchongensis]